MENNWLEQLVALVPPPTNPIHNEGDWQEVERCLGVSLPPDYKEYIHTYGTGIIEPIQLWMFNPFNGNLMYEMIETTAEQVRFPKRSIPSDSPLSSVYLEQSEKLIPWGCSGIGEVFFWFANGDYPNWDILVSEDWLYDHVATKHYSVTKCFLEILQGRSELCPYDVFDSLHFELPDPAPRETIWHDVELIKSEGSWKTYRVDDFLEISIPTLWRPRRIPSTLDLDEEWTLCFGAEERLLSEPEGLASLIYLNLRWYRNEVVDINQVADAFVTRDFQKKVVESNTLSDSNCELPLRILEEEEEKSSWAVVYFLESHGAWCLYFTSNVLSLKDYKPVLDQIAKSLKVLKEPIY